MNPPGEYREVRKRYSNWVTIGAAISDLRRSFPMIPDDARWEIEDLYGEVEVRVIWEVRE